MDWHFRRGDNAEFHPVAVHRQNLNRDAVANDDCFSTLSAENQHVSSLLGRELLRTLLSDAGILPRARNAQVGTVLDHLPEIS
jgi:hypothetical protein